MNHTENILVAYFALKGKETDGRDAKIADALQKKIQEKGLEAAKFAIVPVETYSDDAEEMAAITLREKEARMRPEITSKYSGMKNVRTIILVAPNWHNSVPQAIFTFFDEYDFSGKRIIPVVHHSGDGVDEVTMELRDFLKHVDVFPTVDVDDTKKPEDECPKVAEKVLSLL